MAEFFDRTDLGDLELKDVEASYRKKENYQSQEMTHISLRLPKEDLQALRKMARKAGVGYTTFVRMLIKQAINR